MKLSFNCPPLSASVLARPLVFTWDPETGEVAGPDADLVRKLAAFDAIDAHPAPGTHRLGEAPLHSWVDMAAIVGSEWELPLELRAHYPQPPLQSDGEQIHEVVH
jgi:hypothetical protein